MSRIPTPPGGVNVHDLDVYEKLGQLLYGQERTNIHLGGIQNKLSQIEDTVRPLSELPARVAKLEAEHLQLINRSRSGWMWAGGMALLAVLGGIFGLWSALK